ncbi:MAG: hypothetical protein J6X53_03850 [Abditibacteriota bacterium]|nr:hypothetical protein [Abditibacteriota bacterium]
MRGADVYDFRGTYGGIATAVWIRDINVRTGKPYDIDLMRRLDDEYLSIKDCYTGDYYPLTLWNIDKDKWIAAQFDLPREGRGIIQAFRRPENKDVSITVKLRGLESGADYELTDADSGKSEVITGKALAAGYTLSAKEPGTSIIIRYVKK